MSLLRGAVIFATPVALGIVIGWLRGGSVRGLNTFPLKWFWLVWLAAAGQVAQYTIGVFTEHPHSVQNVVLLVVMYAACGVFLARNWSSTSGLLHTGLVLVAGGFLLNAVPIALNGRMPYSGRAADYLGLSGDTGKGVRIGSGTHVGWLGDVIPLPGIRALVSIGDLVLVAGIIVTVVALMVNAPRSTLATRS
jgi:Family of unknown function (DUF5317)